MKRLLTLLTCVVLVCAFTLGVAASSFTPSVSSKPAPEVTTATDANGNAVTVKVTAVAKKNKLSSAAKEALETAYKELKSTSISKIVPNNGVQTVLDKAYSNVDAKDMVVSDIMDISCKGATGKVTVTVDLGVKKKAAVVTLHKGSNGWEALETKNNGNGTVTFTTDSFSPFAFLVSKGSVSTVKTSPETGLSANIALPVAAVACFAAAGTCINVGKKRD